MKRWSLLLASALIATSSIASAQSTQIVSLDSNGVQGNGQSFAGKVSSDGRYVAFSSLSTNLVPNDVNGRVDAFVRDRLLGTTERVSVDSAGNATNADANADAMSRDGRYVVMASQASNLVAGDTNSARDVFVHDRVMHTTTRVSVGSGGVEGNGIANFGTVITDDGRFVYFSSTASNLVAGDTNGVSDVFQHDRFVGTTVRVSFTTSGGEPNGSCFGPSLSTDGRHLAFVSTATNLVPGDTNNQSDVFVRDLTTGAVVRASVGTGGLQAFGGADTGRISADGRFVVFMSGASNFVAGDSNFAPDIFVHELATGTTTCASVNSNGQQGNRYSERPAISADGRFVAFNGVSSNLDASFPNFELKMFLRDRVAGITKRVDVDSLGAGGAVGLIHSSHSAFLTDDGSIVSYTSMYSDLAPADGNNDFDVFVRTSDPFPPFPYCFGHVANACPCGPGAVGHGCPNSSFASGALLAAAGTTSVSNDTLSLSASSMTGVTCVFLQGIGFADQPLGDARMCLSGTFLRVGQYGLAGGAATNPSGVDLAVSVKGQVPAAGATRYYQATYRSLDLSFCNAQPINRTNGVAIVWYP